MKDPLLSIVCGIGIWNRKDFDLPVDQVDDPILRNSTGSIRTSLSYTVMRKARVCYLYDRKYLICSWMGLFVAIEKW